MDLSAVSIVPPRARDAPLPLRFRLAWSRAGFFVQRWTSRTSERIRASVSPNVEWGAVLRSIIPGWGHYYLGSRRAGLAFAGVWLFLLAYALALAGGPGGWPAYMLVVGWHCFVVNLLLAKPLQLEPVFRRASIGLLVFATINGVVYLPALFLFSRLLVPFYIDGISDSAVLHNGDTVLRTGMWLSPKNYRRGDLVVYRIRGGTIAPGMYVMEGSGIDRIIGEPGDTIRSDGANIFVNDETTASIEPLGRMQMLSAFRSRLGPDEYFVLPSLLQLRGHYVGQTENLVRSLSTISKDMIDGKVVWRTRPWWRAGRLNFAPGGPESAQENVR